MKSSDRLLALRYARAYDTVSRSAQEAQERAGALRQAVQRLAPAAAYMDSPSVPERDKQIFVGHVLADVPAALAFIKVLLAAGRYGLLDACTEQVQLLLEERQGIVRATIQSAAELTAAQKQHTQEVLNQFTGKTVAAVYEVKPELLGGLKVRTGDTLIDASVQGQLDKLAAQLTK